MLKAKKGNKVLMIEDTQARAMQAEGYDVFRLNEKGEQEILYHGAGKTVPYGKYEQVLKELESVKAELASATARAEAAMKPARKR